MSDPIAVLVLAIVELAEARQFGRAAILSGVGAVVHEQKLNVPGVVDEEGLVARGHHVLGLLVGAVSDLFHHITYQYSCSIVRKDFPG